MPKGRLLNPARSASQSQKRSKLQERSTANDINGRTQPGSGNQWHSKGDVKSAHWLVECKTTQQSSFRITDLMWKVLRLNALREGKIPALQIDLQEEKLVAIPYDVWLDLVAADTGSSNAEH